MFKIDQLIYEQINDRLENPTNECDILNILLNSEDEDGNKLSKEELRDQLITLLVAGHDTTATTIAWILYFILRDEKIYNKIKREISEKCSPELIISSESAQKLTYLQNVVKETFRYQPIIPMVARVLNGIFSIDNYIIPDGYTVAPCIYLAGNDVTHWKNPDDFNPDRFLTQSDIDPYYYFPFGGGIRRCIGAAFSLYEINIVIAQILHRYEVTLKSNYKAKPIRHGVTFAPKDGLPISVSDINNANHISVP